MPTLPDTFSPVGAPKALVSDSYMQQFQRSFSTTPTEAYTLLGILLGIAVFAVLLVVVHKHGAEIQGRLRFLYLRLGGGHNAHLTAMLKNKAVPLEIYLQRGNKLKYFCKGRIMEDTGPILLDAERASRETKGFGGQAVAAYFPPATHDGRRFNIFEALIHDVSADTLRLKLPLVYGYEPRRRHARAAVRQEELVMGKLWIGRPYDGPNSFLNVTPHLVFNPHAPAQHGETGANTAHLRDVSPSGLRVFIPAKLPKSDFRDGVTLTFHLLLWDHGLEGYRSVWTSGTIRSRMWDTEENLLLGVQLAYVGADEHGDGRMMQWLRIDPDKGLPELKEFIETLSRPTAPPDSAYAA